MGRLEHGEPSVDAAEVRRPSAVPSGAPACGARSDGALPAGEVVGLLAEGDRLRCVAALVLGASTVVEVATTSGLDVRRAGRALSRLVDGGLVESDRHGYRLLEEELRASARAAAAAASVPDEHGGAPPEVARVLRAFVTQGRLTSIPAVRSKRLVVLDWLAQDFEPGRRYPEPEVNDVLRRRHQDTASLRRALVDEGFMDRAGGRYWRTGGTVETRAGS
jgi:DNA-binding transcriptional ArsR family regulator